MNRTALYVDNIETPMGINLPIPVSYLIADVRDPSKRNSDFTKTIEIPSTQIIDEIFEAAFEVNISFQNFNPNLKKPVRYAINDITVLTGNIQLTRMRINYLTGGVIYICNIKGQLTDLFYTIGDKFLTGNDDSSDDLDFSTYDHPLDKNNVWCTWFPTIVPKTNKVAGVDTTIVDGKGYRYPLIDYGFNGGNLQDYYLHHQRPMLFLYEYMLKIFEKAGKTWTSNFLDSNFFKTLGIPCTEMLLVPDDAKADRQLRVSLATNPNANHPLSYISSRWTSGYSTDVQVCDDNSTLPNADDGTQYNLTNGVITVNSTNQYILRSFAYIKTEILTTDPLNYVDTYDVNLLFEIEKFVSGVWVGVANIGSLDTVPAGPAPNGTTIFEKQLELSYQALFTAGDQYRVICKNAIENAEIKQIYGFFVDESVGPITYNFQFIQDGGTKTYTEMVLVSDNIYEGDTVVVNQSIPKKIKQRDLLTSVIKAFKLMVYPDKDNLNNYFIEPYNDFYTGNYYNWTDKLDAGQDVEIIPMGELDTKQFKFKYKTADDYYNKAYQESWGETYGEKTFEAENEFVNGENVQELIFSATPLVGNLVNGLIIPKIYKQESGTVTAMKTNIRLLQWAGAVLISRGTWSQYYISGLHDTLEYFPYAGHFDNPYAPTFDLGFAAPGTVYYNYGSAPVTYPASNLYTEYHENFTRNITNKNSKLVKAFFNLDEIDIKQFDFRDQIFFKDSYYKINAIRNFDILEPKNTEVELLKLLR